ncbi:MAG TPA: alpha-L-arabinofuranosidase C-terminal domain-containing protein [Bacteroidales bacterium]|nr:alpha-L-arabinofuranosidase C-terminal domain-containing protein [Bacteroidales bacterium]
MKKYIFLLFLVVAAACKPGKESDQGGIIRNPSAEIVDGSVIDGWTSDTRARYAVQFYDNIAHEGSKSLFIKSDRPSTGRWSTKVLLKPWSTYRFSGWIKTEDIAGNNGRGAGFRMDGLKADTIGFIGTNDWTEVIFQFETGNNDCVTLACLLDVKPGGSSQGRVWFDDMKFEYVSSEKINTDVTINTSVKSEIMPEFIYGQFIEHLGRCIYGGIWAEVLEDRKFWYVPGTRESAWRLTGDSKLFSMDNTSPFTGEHSPVLASDGTNNVVLVQENLALKENMGYSGRIVLKGGIGLSSATVTLKSNSGEQKVDISGITNSYKTYELKFNSKALDHNAVLEIAPSGKGKLTVGTLSLMPDDNIEGFRSDVLALLKELNSPVYRWPGGNFVSGYNWRDGLGDRDKRPPRKNPAWSGVEANDVGIHEFMKFCELLKTEPYIAVNAGSGNAQQAMDEMQYVNGAATTPMGKARTANGHAEPWKVKFWSIGNEMYGDWQIGHMSTEQFVEKNNTFADGMWSVDPDAKLIAVGNVGPWDKMILANAANKMNYISEHFYCADNHGGGLLTHVNQIPNAIIEKAQAHREYRKTIPALQGKDIRICMDEWNYWYGPYIYGELGTRYFFRDALGIAAGLNEYSKNTDIIYMANYAQTVNVIGCIKTNGTHSVLDATGQVLKLYRSKYGYIPVEISGELRPLNIGATLTPGGDTLTVSVVNPVMEEVEFPLNISGDEISSTGEIWRVTSPDLMATNEPGRDPFVKIEGPENLNFSGKLVVPPASITIFRLPIKK